MAKPVDPGWCIKRNMWLSDPLTTATLWRSQTKAYAATGFPVTSAAALSVVHGKERPAGGGSRNRPLTSWTDHPKTVNMRLLRNFLRSVRWFTLDPRPHRACLVIMERSYQLEGSLRSA
jgi:hypothetical protein